MEFVGLTQIGRYLMDLIPFIICQKICTFILMKNPLRDMSQRIFHFCLSLNYCYLFTDIYPHSNCSIPHRKKSEIDYIYGKWLSRDMVACIQDWENGKGSLRKIAKSRKISYTTLFYKYVHNLLCI